jgi:23S rRNA pseudouridine2605 synthase
MPSLLHAVTAATGLSRRKAFAAIREGHVSVDGEPRTDPSSPYERGLIAVDGKLVDTGAKPHVYLLLNKPPDYITTVSDEHGRRTVLDLIPARLKAPGLHPVGRLDRDTSGLLLLTTDGDLTHAMTHPRYEVEKEYWLRTQTPLSDAQVAQLRGGIEIDGASRRPLRLRRLVGEEPFQTSITIREGRNRQVRRMLEAAGARVTSLRRVREGALTLGDLPEGAVRPLTQSEVARLKSQHPVSSRRCSPLPQGEG